MNLYFDSEFTGLHQHSSLISLAFIDDNGRAFYAEFTDYAKDQIDDWLQNNILNNTRWINDSDAQVGQWHEGETTLCYADSATIKAALLDWLKPYHKARVWADSPSWDWVLLAELFGGALNLPAAIDYLPLDLSMLFYTQGLDLHSNRVEFANMPIGSHSQQHNALFDAQVLKHCVEKLREITND